ncbi:transposase [Microseira sp. BLCC-F43]|uniref:transposase n=1 Tax=Microseira sp. BLCC-F43 TaxID=3153602 RepID=UPI0035B8095B
MAYDGSKVHKYPNPKHLAKYERKLAKKQRIAARKKKGSNRRRKANKIVARVYEQVSNVRQDYLHKLSRKIVDNNQVVVVENLNLLAAWFAITPLSSPLIGGTEGGLILAGELLSISWTTN